MAEEETAQAEQSSAPKKIADPIKGGRFTTIRNAKGSTPGLIYTGVEPKVGTKLRATMANGVTYAGIVAEAEDVDGEVMVEFRDGVAPE